MSRVQEQSSNGVDGQHIGDSGRINDPASSSISLQDLKSARTVARRNRTRLANVLKRVKADIANYQESEDLPEGEEDAEYESLLSKEDSLESQLADAEVAVAEAERAVDDQLLVDVQRRLPAPTLLTSGLAQQDPVGHPDVTASPVASLQGRRQAATPRSAGLSSNTAQSNDSVSKVLIPKLADPYNFVNHLNMFCRIMVDHGHGRFVDGAFVPSGQETSLVVKLVKSVDKCASLHQAAESAAQTSTYQWGPTVGSLVRQFGSKETIRTEVARKLKNLKFQSVGMAEAFNQQLTIIGNSWFSVYGSEPAEVRFLADNFLRKLPPDVLKSLTSHILALLPQDAIARWENHLQLHEDAPLPTSSPSICLTTAIATVCKSIEIAESLGGTASVPGFRRFDKVHRVGDSSSPTPISDFVSKHAVGSVMYFRTDRTDISDDSLQDHFSRLGSKSTMVLHHPRGHTYGFAAFDDATRMESAIPTATSEALGVTARRYEKPGNGGGPRFGRRR